MWITTNWKILKEMGIPDHLICLLKISMKVKKQQSEIDMEQWTGSKMRKDYVNAVYCQPPYLIYMQSTSCEMLGWMNQEGITIAGRNISNLRHADDTTVMAESKEDLKSLLRVKEESKKAGLKLSIQKMKIIASHPITSWQRDGEKAETVTDFIFLGSKITADSDCSHEIKRHLLLGRKAMTNLNSVLKAYITVNKGPFSQRYGFSSSHVQM